MNPDRDRDRLLDEALEHQLGAGRETAASTGCLDAETLAAWMDGGLDTHAVLMAEAHASNCSRCQALLATVARTTPGAAVAAPHVRLWRWWFAPLAATAAAVTVWMVVPQEPANQPAVAPQDFALSEPAAAPMATPPAPAPSPAPMAPPAAARKRASAPPEPRAEMAQAQKAEALKLADRAAEDRVAAAPPAAAMAREQAVSFADAQVTARSSPSPNVIWAVGRAGLVQLATDGRTFVRLAFPEAVDLTAVTATDERTATVTTADGRLFQTADGGRTWTRP